MSITSGASSAITSPRRSLLVAAGVVAAIAIAVLVITQPFAATSTSSVSLDQINVDQVQGLVATPASPPLTDEIGDDIGVSSTGAVALEWTNGLASTLACNQLVGSDFADGSLPVDYYDDPPDRERVVTQGGVADSWALEIGIENGAGQYAEVVPVVAGRDYWFRGWFNRQGPVEAAEMGIALLDPDYRVLDLTVTEQMALTTAGFHEVEFIDIPDDAAFALPYLSKGASPGVVIADELVFGATADCFDEISQTGG